MNDLEVKIGKLERDNKALKSINDQLTEHIEYLERNRMVKIPKEQVALTYVDTIVTYHKGYNQAILDVKKLNPHLKFEE